MSKSRGEAAPNVGLTSLHATFQCGAAAKLQVRKERLNGSRNSETQNLDLYNVDLQTNEMPPVTAWRQISSVPKNLVLHVDRLAFENGRPITNRTAIDLFGAPAVHFGSDEFFTRAVVMHDRPTTTIDRNTIFWKIDGIWWHSNDSSVTKAERKDAQDGKHGQCCMILLKQTTAGAKAQGPRKGQSVELGLRAGWADRGEREENEPTDRRLPNIYTTPSLLLPVIIS